MSATAAPFGLRPVQSLNGNPYTGPFREIKMTTNSSAAIFTGDVVQLASGEPAAMASTPTTSSAGVVGVCVGVRYVTPDLKQPMFAQFLPAGAISAGYTDVWIRVVDDPEAIFMIQGAGSIARNKIGALAALGNFGGSTVTGNSTINLVAPTSTTTLAMRVIDFVESTTSTAGDSFTDVYVKWNQGVHMYANTANAGA